jgi:phage recombination protein Bet
MKKKSVFAFLQKKPAKQPKEKSVKEQKAIVPAPLPVVTEKDIEKYMVAFGIGSQLDTNEKRQFIEIATAYSLNPFKREIYCVAYESRGERRLSIITGYEVYLKRAERSGQLDGWDVTFTGNGNDLKAHITIWRKDRSQPIKHSVDFKEYVQTTWKNGKQVPNKFWAEKPKTMLRKVAISQGFRLAFPDELGGMPYTADELPDEMTKPKNVTPPVDVKEGQSDTSQGFHERNEAANVPKNVTPDKPKETKQDPPNDEATSRLNKVYEAFDWEGHDPEREYVVDQIAKKVNDAKADEIIDRIMALGLKKAVF